MSSSPSRARWSPDAPTYGALFRAGSPPAGFSTLITVAPSAPRSCVAYGPGERDRQVDDGDPLERARELLCRHARPYLRSPNTPRRRVPRGGAQRADARRLDRHRRGRADPLHGRVPLGRDGRDRASTASSGCSRSGRGDYPRRHVEADYLRVLVFDDEVEVRLRVDVGRPDVDPLRLGGAARRRGRDHGEPHDRPRRRRRAGRRRSTSARARCSRVSRNLILSRRRTRRATGIPTPPGGRSRPDRFPTRASRTPGRGRGARSPASTACSAASGPCSGTTSWSRPPSTRAFSNVVPFFNTRRPPLECDPPEHTRLPPAAQPLLLARAARRARGAAPALRGRDARRRSSTAGRGTSPSRSATRSRPRALPACSSFPTATGG